MAGVSGSIFAQSNAPAEEPAPPRDLTWDDSITNGLGSWIWSSNTFDRQTCQFWRAFDIPSSNAVLHAQLRMTVDNEYTLYLDGRELGRGAEWRELFDYNVTPLMTPGRHTLAVVAYNSSFYAGLLFGLRIDLADGSALLIQSDSSWRVVPNETADWMRAGTPHPDWAPAKVVFPLGSPPWWKIPENVNAMPTLQPIKVYFWQTGWFQVALLSVCGIAVLISLRLVAQLAAHRKERWLLQRERARIARDIHDDLGSRMTQLVLHGEVAQSELPPDSPTRVQIERVCDEARSVLSTMDEILWAMNPKRDTFRDFASYVCDYAQEYLKSTPIRCLFEVDPEMTAIALDLPLRRTLLMIIKEALNNAVKHSHATELALEIRWHAPKLAIAVTDNGAGFDLTNHRAGRNGLANMAQRMREVGGYCHVASQPGKGCRVEFGLALGEAHWPSWRWRVKKTVAEPLAETRTI